MERLCRTMSAVVAVTGVLVLLGWLFDVTLLKSVVPGLVAMNPGTALCFIVAGAALYLSRRDPVSARDEKLSRLCTAAILLVSGSVLLRYVGGGEFALDQLLFREKLAQAADLGHRNRMAPNTALMFVLMASSLLGLDHRSLTVRKCSELLCLATGLLAYLALTGYLYGATRLYGVPSYIPIALNTALAFGALAVGTLAARPGRGLSALLLTASPGGVLLRRLLPASLGLPLILGLIGLMGQDRGLYDAVGGVAFFATLTTLSLASMVYWSAVSLDRADIARRQAEVRLRDVNQDLETRVAERTVELRAEIEVRADAEAALRAQREFLRKVVDANPQLVFIKDWNGRFLLANAPVAALYGTTVSELEGKSDADFNPNASQVESYLRADREVMQSGRPLQVAEEPVADAKTGETRWFQTVKVPLIAPDGARQVLGVSTDITERRQAKERLRRTADELRALVQAAPVAIVGIDMEGKVLSWYGGAQRMFGWAASEVVGKPLAIVPGEKQDEFSALRMRVQAGESIIDLESHRIRKDGSRIDVSISYAPLYDHTGKTIGAIIVYQDIAERRLVAEQRQARETADAANQAKSNFLANMSHELRTPLNAIIGFSELLEEKSLGELNERQRRYVGNVLSSGRHLLQLVNDILDLAKIEAGRLTLEPQRIDLSSLLHDLQRGLEPLASAKRLSLSLELAPDLPPLTADVGKVKQIMYNLLSNAIKFTKDGGRVGVRAAAASDSGGEQQIRISVWDTGVGIAAADLERIFLEFEQIDSTYVRQQEGTGLGLALTKRLVEAHGGRLWVESTVNEGSTFSILLPAELRHTSVESRDPTLVETRETNGDAPLVLVVEDDTSSRELLSHYLSSRGYRVAYAGSAAQALELASSLRPNVISLDMFLPDGHGLEVLTKLRGNPATKGIPVVVVSITDDRELGVTAGAAAWLVKPVRRHEFIAALDRLAPSTSGNGRRLALVVDDDPEAVELASDVLRGRGFEVLQAFGGIEGIDLAIQHAPSLIILDLNMPGVSGFTVAQQLRAHPNTRQTPILVSTAMDLTGPQREALMRDVQTVVAKRGAEELLRALERFGLTPPVEQGASTKGRTA